MSLLADKTPNPPTPERVHSLGNRRVCATDTRGYATPRNLDPSRLVLDRPSGFIPLWDQGVTLRWRFNRDSLAAFARPDQVRDQIEDRLQRAVLAWGPSAPVAFTKNEDNWDFEVVPRAADDCDDYGCVLASAFFPDAGRHRLIVYPKLFEQSEKEQVDTFIHELGHVFGLRHFFATVRESAWPATIWGTHEAFSIMNYGDLSELTAADLNDLQLLYEQVWSGQLATINGTPIRLVQPYHATGYQRVRRYS